MRMGLPRVVVSDNGRQFDNKLNDEICIRLKIKRRFIPPYHSQVGTQDLTCIIMIAQVFLYVVFAL